MGWYSPRPDDRVPLKRADEPAGGRRCPPRRRLSAAAFEVEPRLRRVDYRVSIGGNINTMLQAEMYKVGTIGNGFIAIMAHPSLDPEAAASVLNISRLGIKLVVSLLEPTEARQLGLESERGEVKAHAMDFVSFPIPDMGLPPSAEDFARMTRTLFKQVNMGVNTLVHCRAGIGRSGLFSAGVLLHVGMSPDEAFDYVSKMRGIRVPETPEQREWLVRNYNAIMAKP